MTDVTINSDAILDRTYTSSSNLSSIFGDKVTKYTIGYDVKSIGDYAFFGCCKLTSLYFPNTIKNIGDYAFYNCNQIAFIDFGSADLITNLNSYIFYGTAISSIIIPASVTSISSNAFNSCTNLTTVTFALGSKISSISGGYTFKGCTSLLSISFPDTLRSIGSCIFMNCTSLISLDISNTQIYSIPQYAFSGCSSLETLYLPNNLTSIGSSAFINCSALTNIYTNNSSNVTINDSAFQDCTSLIYIGDISGNSPITIGYVGDTSFAGCKSILEIHLTNTVTSIGIQTFKDCEELQYINIPTSVSSIGLDAFEGAFTKSIPQGDNSTTYGIYFDFGTETSSVWTYIAINHVTNFRSEFKLNKTDSIYRITMNIKIYSSSSYTKATMLRKTS